MKLGPEQRERDRFIDVLRVVAVVIVVGGHWMATSVIWDAERIGGENALSVIPESHPATWLLQVMPLLFFVGGFANSRALARHGGDYLAFLRTRLHRLLAPTLAFMGVWLLIAVVAEPMPLPEPNIVERAADIAALPFWFLGLYVVVVALAPPMLRLHRRLGWWVPAALAAGAAAVDGVVHGLGHEAVGVANYAFVWLLPHQLGFFYEEGRLERISGIAAGTVALAGLTGLVLAVTVAGYPVSMIGVPGEDRWNTDPPSLALIALTAWLLGLALLARSRIATHQGGYSSVVRRLGTITLTTYLWHVSAVAIGAGIVYPLGFPTPDTGSLTWWLVRPLWIAVLVPWLMLLVVVFGRFEVHPRPRPVVPTSHESRRHVAAGIAVVSLAFGILGFGVTGFDHPATEYGGTVLAFSMNPLQNVVHVVAGLAVLGSVYAPDRFPGGAYVVSSLYVALGAIGWSDGVRTLAMNSATARLLVAVGALGLVALILAAAHDRRLRHRETWLDRRSS